MLNTKIVILTIWISLFNISESFNFRYDYDNFSIGEQCVTKYNEPGTCTELVKCKIADQLYRSKQSSEITLCKVVGRIPFVCCPSYPKDLIASPLVIKSSTKFQNALCKNVQIFEKLDNHIISGDKAEVSEFPFQVALGYFSQEIKSFNFDCGGSLIADDIVLTAAHCVNIKGAQPVMVRLGRTSLDLNDEYDESDHQDIKIEAIRIHPKYCVKYKHNDIAIIKLRKPFKPSDSIETICLSTSDANAPKDFTVTGFGITSLEYTKRSDWLLKGTITEYPHDKCKYEYGKKGIKVIDSQLCALSDKGVDSCHGDSGGPVSYQKNNKHYLFGITSFGSGCGSSVFPSIYTKVNRYLDWIEEEMSTFE
ncbi:unnamed protein product [Chironomus riparius]|uniref:Peptidase S1 domain-containing protein n=1 Tax=Chironomus riparius TaxID=315576 RepID=A0A9N9WQF5_9DIPT|nr:unnamed protein product [Chironomus riparius]